MSTIVTPKILGNPWGRNGNFVANPQTYAIHTPKILGDVWNKNVTKSTNSGTGSAASRQRGVDHAKLNQERNLRKQIAQVIQTMQMPVQNSNSSIANNNSPAQEGHSHANGLGLTPICSQGCIDLLNSLKQNNTTVSVQVQNTKTVQTAHHVQSTQTQQSAQPEMTRVQLIDALKKSNIRANFDIFFIEDLKECYKLLHKLSNIVDAINAMNPILSKYR